MDQEYIEEELYKISATLTPDQTSIINTTIKLLRELEVELDQSNISLEYKRWQPIETAPHGKLVLMFAVGECWYLGIRWHTGVIEICGEIFDPGGGTKLYPNDNYDDEFRIVAWTHLQEKPFTYKPNLSNNDISKLLEQKK